MFLNKLQDSLNPQPKGEIFIVYIFLKFRIWNSRGGRGENRDRNMSFVEWRGSKLSILPASTCSFFSPLFLVSHHPCITYDFFSPFCFSAPEGQKLLGMKHVLNPKARGSVREMPARACSTHKRVIHHLSCNNTSLRAEKRLWFLPGHCPYWSSWTPKPSHGAFNQAG